MSNTFGKIFRLTTFGESHGPALGGIIDGCPAGIVLDTDAIAAQMRRRRPGQSSITTSRIERDEVQILSGVHNGITTGTPIGFCILNEAQRSQDYSEISQAFRPGHADFTYFKKYEGFNDIRGGGRSSARETACRIVGGAVATQVLKRMIPGLKITAYTQSVGEVQVVKPYAELDFSKIDQNAVRCPDTDIASQMERLIIEVKTEGDTVGGIIECVIQGCPVSVGEPVFNKLNGSLAAAMMSINAAKGFEIGDGFTATRMRGSASLDTWVPDPTDARGVRSQANHSGGIQGGISNGEDIVFRVAFKPVATLLQPVHTVDKDLRPTILAARGRHDPCVVPRAVPIVESMAAMVILDQFMLGRAHSL